VDNGVQINIGNTGGVPGNTFADYSHLQTVEDPTGQNIQVTFRGGGNPLLSNPNSDEAVMAVAHEGIHVQDAEDWASRGFTDEPTLLQTEFRAYGVTSLVGEARGAAILIGTSPPPNPNNTQFPFWSKGYSQPVNNMLRTGMIKAINPQWALGAWTRNTQGGGD
jgi:hypothetical protein